MGTHAPPHIGASPHPGRLTHAQAVALLEVVAHLVDAAGSEAERTAPTPSRMAALVAAMEAVGIDGAVIHAYRQTGYILASHWTVSGETVQWFVPVELGPGAQDTIDLTDRNGGWPQS